MKAPTLFDAIIIGSGPGGLSTALGLARQNRTCIVISHKQFRNDGIEASHAVLGHDHIAPQEIWALGREQIARYGTATYAQAEIVSATKKPLPSWHGGAAGGQHEGFEVTSTDGRRWSGKTVVLATGVRDVFPAIDGYRENWPRNIYQCLFCDGWERREMQKAVLCSGPLTMQEAKMASMALGQHTERGGADGLATVKILTNGTWDLNSADGQLARQVKALMARGVTLDQRKVVKLEPADPEGRDAGVYVHLREHNDKSGSSTEKVFFGFLIHKPRTTLNVPDLIQQLGLKTASGMFGDYVKGDSPGMNTNVSGVYVAGDAGTEMTHVTTALVSGVGAAGGISHYLNGLEDEDALEQEGSGSVAR